MLFLLYWLFQERAAKTLTAGTITPRTSSGTKASITPGANGAATRVTVTPASEDGSVVLNYEGQRYVIPDQLVLKGTNPTGHAVWWFLEGPTGRTTYCFAPGTLS